MKLRALFERQTFSWALYDWANSAFATTVVAGFFPIFFRQYWSAGEDPASTTFRLGIATSVTSLLIILIGPVLGAIADRAGAKKKFLAMFAFLGVLSTAGLYLVGQGDWLFALTLFVLGSVGFAGGNVFYDALLMVVAPTRERIHMTSCAGFALGYLGGGILFLVNVLMVLNPELFGFEDASHALRISFVSVALWWAAFSIPILVFVDEPAVRAESGAGVISSSLRDIFDTLRLIAGRRTVVLFLLAYWFYIDGVGTVFRMAVDYGLAIGLNRDDLIGALLVVQFVGFPAALAFGWIGQRFGPRPGIYCGIAMYILVTVWAYFITSGAEFYILAVMVGLVQGGVQALSRSLYAQLIPQDQAGQYFGIFNMIGKAAAVMGPVLVGVSAVAFGNRVSILSVIVLFAIGAIVLHFVRPASLASAESS